MRKWVTTLLTIAAVVAAGAVSLTALAPAGAATHRVSHTPTAMRKQLAALVARGATDAQIRQATGLRRVSTAGRTPMSSYSAVSVSTPAVYWDNLAHEYYVTAGWKFSSVPDACDLLCKIGGLDGFGIRFSQDINNMGGSLYLCSKAHALPCDYATSYWDNSEYGAAWKFQDESLGTDDYLPWSGSLVFGFKRLHTGCLQVFTRYEHNWSSTSIRGFTVGKTSFGVSWTSTSHHWQRTSNAGKLGCS